MSRWRTLDLLFSHPSCHSLSSSFPSHDILSLFASLAFSISFGNCMHSASRSRRAYTYLLVPKRHKNRSRRLTPFFPSVSKYPQYNISFLSNHEFFRLSRSCFRSAGPGMPDLDPPSGIDTFPVEGVCQIWTDTGYWVNRTLRMQMRSPMRLCNLPPCFSPGLRTICNLQYCCVTSSVTSQASLPLPETAVMHTLHLAAAKCHRQCMSHLSPVCG